MTDFNIKLSCEVPFVNLDGTCNIRMGDKIYKIDISNDVKNLIDNYLREVAIDSFIDTTDELNGKIIDSSLEEVYNKTDFIELLLYAIKNKKVLMTGFRGIGKSTFITKVAESFKLPIVTGTFKKAECYNGYSDIFKVYEIKEEQPCTILADELSYEDVIGLRKLGFEVIGFIRNQKCY